MSEASNGQEIQRKKDTAAEILEILERVPENRKGEALGILQGFALGAESEQKGA